MFFEKIFSADTINAIQADVNKIRAAAPNKSNNMMFRSANITNTWWRRNPDTLRALIDLEKRLTDPLPQNIKTQVYGSLLLIRHVPSISRKGPNGKSYINRQTLHVNYEKHPTYGESFMQIIYYIDTPRYTNGSVANSGDRGKLLVSKRGNKTGNTAQVLIPEKGRAVYFTPVDTWHEVVDQNQIVNVDRKMLIMFLYKRPSNTEEISTQIRNYNQTFRKMLQNKSQPTNPIVRNLANFLKNLSLLSRKQKRVNNTNTRPQKRRRVVSPYTGVMNMNTNVVTRKKRKTPALIKSFTGIRKK